MNSHLTSSVLIYSPDLENVLLIEHRVLGLWVYPGGHLESDEDPAECAIREAQEEVGLQISLHSGPGARLQETLRKFAPEETKVLPQPFVILSEVIEGGSEGRHRHIDLVFLATAVGEPTACSDEAVQAKWIKVDSCVELRMPRELPFLIDRARDYLRKHLGETKSHIDSESMS